MSLVSLSVYYLIEANILHNTKIISLYTISVSSTVWCVDTVPANGDNYVTLYNGNDPEDDINGVDVYRFSCMVKIIAICCGMYMRMNRTIS